MSEEMAADGPHPVLTDQLIDALYEAYQAFLEVHPGAVSSATATNGALRAVAKILIVVHRHAHPDEEELVSWDASKDACVAELAWMLSEPQNAGGGRSSDSTTWKIHDPPVWGPSSFTSRPPSAWRPASVATS